MNAVRFLADAMLGRLARWLRVLGWDTAYDPAIHDPALVDWAQAKIHQTEKLEWNAAVGQDSLLAKALRIYPLAPNSYYNSSMARNRSGLVNFIYRPRSDIVLSVEYRRLRMFSLSGYSQFADHLNLGLGVLF